MRWLVLAVLICGCGSVVAEPTTDAVTGDAGTDAGAEHAPAILYAGNCKPPNLPDIYALRVESCVSNPQVGTCYWVRKDNSVVAQAVGCSADPGSPHGPSPCLDHCE